MTKPGRADNDPLINGYDEVENIGEELSLRTGDVHTVVGGVSIAWLMRVFGMGRQTVEKKLVGLKPIGHGSHHTPLYTVPEAASRLVKPTEQIDKILLNLKPQDMPERLREAYWNSKLKQQRFEERAGQLWRTEKILMVVGELLQEMKQKALMIPDDVERELGLDRDDHKKVQAIVDNFQKEMYEWLLALQAGRLTPNQLGEEDEDELPEEDNI